MLAPSDRPSIRTALEELHAESVRYWSAMDTASFLAPIGAAWSPAENVRHLTKSMRAVAVGLRAPRLVLYFRFGRPKRPSRSFDELREFYLARLAQGADAGAFGPGPRQPIIDTEAERAKVMAYHAQALTEFYAAMDRWPERALDARQLPHPLLGNLTVREMLFFTVYHNRHHLENVKRRLAQR